MSGFYPATSHLSPHTMETLPIRRTASTVVSQRSGSGNCSSVNSMHQRGLNNLFPGKATSSGHPKASHSNVFQGLSVAQEGFRRSPSQVSRGYFCVCLVYLLLLELYSSWSLPCLLLSGLTP